MQDTEELVEVAPGVSLWTATRGTGQPVLLMPGGPGMADYLGPVADLMDPARFRIHRYEPRGCGRSGGAAPFTLADAIADIDALRRHFGHGAWTLIGHSFGVDLGLAQILERPAGVAGLVGLCGGRIVNDRDWHKAYSDRRAEEPLPAAWGPHNPEANAGLNADWRAYCRRPGLLKDLAAIRHPVRFLLAEHDIRPHWPTRQLAALIGAEVEVIPRADHNLWTGNPEGVREAFAEIHQL